MTNTFKQYLSLKNASKLLQHRPHCSTLTRWSQRGCRGVRLRTYLVGGIRCTTAEDLQIFVDQVTAAANQPHLDHPQAKPHRVTPLDPTASGICRAERELDRRGVHAAQAAK